jgi:hypothetical protein
LEGGKVIRINETKVSPKRQKKKKKIKNQINGKCNNIGSADKKKSIYIKVNVCVRVCVYVPA